MTFREKVESVLKETFPIVKDEVIDYVLSFILRANEGSLMKSFNMGYNTAAKDFKNTTYSDKEMNDAINEAHDKGIEDAWNCAMKIADMTQEERVECFGTKKECKEIISNHTYERCMDMIKNYQEARAAKAKEKLRANKNNDSEKYSTKPRWIRDRFFDDSVGMMLNYGYYYKCSECGYEVKVSGDKCYMNFCPNCRADMRIEKCDEDCEHCEYVTCPMEKED